MWAQVTEYVGASDRKRVGASDRERVGASDGATEGAVALQPHMFLASAPKLYAYPELPMIQIPTLKHRALKPKNPHYPNYSRLAPLRRRCVVVAEGP